MRVLIGIFFDFVGQVLIIKLGIFFNFRVGSGSGLVIKSDFPVGSGSGLVIKWEFFYFVGRVLIMKSGIFFDFGWVRDQD